MLRRIAFTLVVLAFLFVPSTSSTPGAQAQAGRDPLTWPFPWDSIWNMPIGSGATYVDAQIEPGRQFGVFADEDILILEPDAPLVDVLVHDADWDPALQRCDRIVSPQQVQISGVPVPAGFSTEIDNDGTPNAAAAILMPDGETVVQTQPLHVCGPGGPVVSQYRFQDDNLRTGDGIAGAHGGASMSSIGGTIRVGELTPGSTINHALKVVIDSTQYTFFDANDPTPGFRWPAGSADAGAEFGYGGSVPEVEMGSLLALRPDFDIGALRTEPARIIAQTMMDFGGYVVDSAGWDAHYFATEFGPNGRVIDEFESNWGWPYLSPQTATCGNTSDPACAWSTDMGDIFSGLHVVANNSPTTIGGPGARRADCAPAFTDGTGGAPVDCSPSTTTPRTCNGLAATIDMNTGASGIGTAGEDVILGTPGNDVIDAGGGNDLVCAGGGDDTVVGGSGNDTLLGGAGRDIMRGNSGVDVIEGEAGNDRLLGGTDGDTLVGGDGDDHLGGFGGADTIVGGPGNDTIFGGFGADTIDGGDGNDTIFGLVGDDTIEGGGGNDELHGDRGNDFINGGGGDDLILGGNANDVLHGGAGDDSVNGGRADDQLSGGAGTNDTCVGNKQNNADTADASCEQIFGVP